jgi:hypothetical protein
VLLVKKIVKTRLVLAQDGFNNKRVLITQMLF